MDLDEILREMGTFTGVLGVFVCDSSGNLLAAHPPSLKTAPEFAEVGRIAARTMTSLAALNRRLPDEIDMSFEKGRVVLRSAGSDASLGAICQPSLNPLMLKLKTAVVVKAVAALRDSLTRERPKADLNERVRKAVESVLGARAAKPLTLVTAAGESRQQLQAAGAEAVRFAELFLGKDKADELRRRLRLVLGREP